MAMPLSDWTATRSDETLERIWVDCNGTDAQWMADVVFAEMLKRPDFCASNDDLRWELATKCSHPAR